MRQIWHGDSRNTKVAEQEGAERWAKSPRQVIAYASVHDNLTLWDKLVATMQASAKERNYDFDPELLARQQTSSSHLFTSQGAVLTQAGEELAVPNKETKILSVHR